jgi:O-antigen/teichoic acid export membrane protein
MKRIDNLSVRGKVAFGTVTQIASKLAVAVLSIFTLRYSTQYLGAEVYGQYATIVAYVTIFTLLTDLGLTAISSREIAKYPQYASKIIGNSLAMRVLLSVVISPLIAIGGWWLYAAKPGQVKVGIALMVLTLVFGSVQSVVSALFTAKHRNDVPALLGVINKIAYLLCIVAAGTLGFGLYGFVYAAIITAFVTAAIGTYWAAKRISLHPRFNMPQWKYLMKTSIPLGIIQIINLLYYKVDTVMLSVMRTPKEVGLYTIAYGIIDVVITIPSMFMTSLMPSLAVADRPQLQRLVERAFSILAFVAIPIAVGGLMLSRETILLISSPEFADAALPFAILVVGAAFAFLNGAFGFATVAINQQSRMLKVSVLTIILNVGINLFTIPRYGVVGAAVATLITEAIAFAGIYLVFTKQTGIRINFLSLWKVLLAGAVMIPAKLLVDKAGLPLFASFLTAGTAMSAVYLGLMVVCKGIPDDFQPMVKHLTGRK